MLNCQKNPNWHILVLLSLLPIWDELLRYGLIRLYRYKHFLYDVNADDIPRDFLLAWQQMVLPFEHGGHGLRRWQQHADAAFVGQWALSVQTGWDDEAGHTGYTF